jgi:hypothetical protein
VPTIGDLTWWPLGASGAAAAGAGPAGASAGAGAATAAGIIIGAAMPWPAGPPFTMRTLPSASVISSSETLDSDTRSISVLSLRKSMGRFSCLVLRGGEFTAKFAYFPQFAGTDCKFV